MKKTGKKQGMLPENFFKDNIIDDLSPQMFTFFYAKMFAAPEGKKLLDSTQELLFDSERQKLINEERQYIEHLSNPQDIMRYMRKIKDVNNRCLLIEKVLAYQEDVIPLIISKLRTSGYDIFIEMAAAAMLLTDEKYLHLLQEQFDEIRNPYARSEACLAFAREGKTEYTSFLLEQFNLLKKNYKTESYYNGPLIALSIIYTNDR